MKSFHYLICYGKFYITKKQKYFRNITIMTRFRYGRHLSSRHGLSFIPQYAYDLGMGVFQVFFGVPHQVLSKPKSNGELISLSKNIEKYHLKCTIHGSYTINFCHPSTEKMFKTSLKSLVQDLHASNIIGKRCLGVVIHMGKNIPLLHISNDEALQNYIYGIKEALKNSPEDTTIILETGASQGHEVGSKIDGLKIIYQSLNKNERKRIKFCIDTCHIFATGYDISTIDGVHDFFEEFNKKIGIDKIACIHFNDSNSSLNSHVDRHADIGYGKIGLEGLREVFKLAHHYKIPLITETPLDAINPKTNREITLQDELKIINLFLKNIIKK
jgi:deoxyribonuclease-4